MSLRSFAFVRCAFGNFLDVDIDDNFVFQDKLEIPTYVRSRASIDMIASLIEWHGVFLFKTPFIAKLNSTVKCCATFLYRRRFTWFLTVNELFASDIVPVPFSSNFTVKEAEPSFKQKKYLLVMKCERKHMNYRKCKMVDLFLRQLDSCTAPEWVHERHIVNQTSWSQ